MSNKAISKAVSQRICDHMNKDHKDALRKYSELYAGITVSKTIEMIEITEKSMELKVDSKIISISFDHTLKDSSDAHTTLVDMLKRN